MHKWQLSWKKILYSTVYQLYFIKLGGKRKCGICIKCNIIQSLRKGNSVRYYNLKHFENVMLSEISLLQKDKTSMIPLTWCVQSSQILTNRKVEWWLPGPGEEEMVNYCSWVWRTVRNSVHTFNTVVLYS